MDKAGYGTEEDFIDGWNTIERNVHRIAKDKGWWDGGERNNGEMIALIHSEQARHWKYCGNIHWRIPTILMRLPLRKSLRMLLSGLWTWPLAGGGMLPRR